MRHYLKSEDYLWLLLAVSCLCFYFLMRRKRKIKNESKTVSIEGLRGGGHLLIYLNVYDVKSQ